MHTSIKEPAAIRLCVLVTSITWTSPEFRLNWANENSVLPPTLLGIPFKLILKCLHEIHNMNLWTIPVFLNCCYYSQVWTAKQVALPHLYNDTESCSSQVFISNSCIQHIINSKLWIIKTNKKTVTCCTLKVLPRGEALMCREHWSFFHGHPACHTDQARLKV